MNQFTADIFPVSRYDEIDRFLVFVEQLQLACDLLVRPKAGVDFDGSNVD